MKWKELAKKLSGLQTVSTVAKKLEVNRRTAINYIYELRKRGYAETTRGRKKIRMYEINPILRRKIGYAGLYETINRYSPIKIVEPYEHRIYDHKLTVEEAVVRAIKTKEFRTILSALALFQKVQSWSRLYKFAKEDCEERAVGALYDLSRKCVRVRRMDKRIRNRLKQAKIKNRYIIPSIKSKDFKDIQLEWGIFIPFNSSDLERYKEVRI